MLDFIVTKPVSAEELMLLICFGIILFSLVVWATFALVEKIISVCKAFKNIRDYLTW